MECASNDENGSSNIHLQKKQRKDDRIRSVMLDFDVLDCPICFEPLTIPIFQCENGHLACSSCCPKLSNKCPQCGLPIGKNRCRSMESILESIFVKCRNAEFGCTENVTYWKETTHEDKCIFSQCSCPELKCDFTCSYKDLFSHYIRSHIRLYVALMFNYGDSHIVDMSVCNKVFVMFSTQDYQMFAVQSIKESYGVYVTVNCIAPNAQLIGEFSCRLSYTALDGNKVTYQIQKVKKVLKVSFEISQENVMLIPQSLLSGQSLKMKVCIKKLI